MRIEFKFLTVFLLAGFIWSCTPSTSNEGDISIAENSDIAADAPSTEKGEDGKVITKVPDNAPVVYPNPNSLDLSTMTKGETIESEGGDCMSITTSYENKTFKLVKSDHDCGGYGNGTTLYLSDKEDNLLAVYELDAGGDLVEPQDGNPMYQLKERTYYFYPKGIEVSGYTDTVQNLRALTYRKPWLYSDHDKGEYKVFNEEFQVSWDEWYDNTKNYLKEVLSTMETLPAEIPQETKGGLMGIRGEFRSLCEEAIQEVKDERAKGAKVAPPYAQTKKKAAPVERQEYDMKKADWERNLKSLFSPNTEVD